MWTYEQTSGRLYDPEGNLRATGYAGGNCGKNPEGINNHAMQGFRSIGPLPVGFYTFGVMVHPHPHLGAYALKLIPDADNEMFGRSLFYMHGDTPQPRCASEGCIIMPRQVRLACGESDDRRLQVVARVDNGDLA